MVRIDDRLFALERRHAAIEQENQQLKQRLDQMAASRLSDQQDMRGQTAALTAAVEKAQHELRLINGRLDDSEGIGKQRPKMGNEGADARSNQDLLRLDQIGRDHEGRLTQIEQYLNLERVAAAAPAAAKDPSGKAIAAAVGPQTAGPSEEQLYNTAKQAFDQGNFEKARQGFQELLSRFAKSTNADNAQFWIGETYYQEKWFEKAILEYQKVIENYPKGNKVQTALLKQGMAFSNLGDHPNARLILREVIKKYPQSNEAVLAKKKLDEIK
jgi:tol-pal system protein YbgF